MKKEDLEKVIITSLGLIKKCNFAEAERLLQDTFYQIETDKRNQGGHIIILPSEGIYFEAFMVSYNNDNDFIRYTKYVKRAYIFKSNEEQRLKEIMERIENDGYECSTVKVNG